MNKDIDGPRVLNVSLSPLILTFVVPFSSYDLGPRHFAKFAIWLFWPCPIPQRIQCNIVLLYFDSNSYMWQHPWRVTMAKHHPDLIFCRKQPGVAIGRLCEKCDGRCVICDSYVRPCTLVRICDECNYGSYQVGTCIVY